AGAAATAPTTTTAAARPAAAGAAARRREVDDHGEDERQGTGNQRDAKTAEQKPGQHGNDAARRNRAHQPPERASQDTAAHQREEQPERIERIEVGAVPMRRFRLRQLLAVDEADHAIDAGGDAAGEITALELRRDDLVDGALGGNVRQRAFEAVANFDTQA